MLDRDNVSLAEISWSLNVVQSSYSHCLFDDISDLFQAMISGHKKVERSSWGRIKCEYIRNFGLAPFF